jgi:hypothetical protein
VAREALLGHILLELERCFDIFADKGFGPLQEAYLAHWMHGALARPYHGAGLHA